MIAAPLTVVVTLLVARNVWLTFGCYHLLVCLVLPWLDTVLVRRRSTIDHLRFVGLVDGWGNGAGAGDRSENPASIISGGRAGVQSRGPKGNRASINSGIRIGLGLGLLLGSGTILIFAIWGDVFLAGNKIKEVLASWNVTPVQYPLMMAFMILGNGAAEELFWRGYIHRRLELVPQRGLAIGLTALAYTSYHVVTLGSFLAEIWLIVFCTVSVFVAGLFWGWLRERYGNVWPALLGHVGATAGYMVVFWQEIAMG
jgi:membrane protease YdiL (CAAX protease family)